MRNCIQISPAVKSRHVFEQGQFMLVYGLLRTSIIRKEVYQHQVHWNYSQGWETTFKQNYYFTVDTFLSRKKALETLKVLNERYSNTTAIFPPILGEIGDAYFNIKLDLTPIHNEVKRRLN